MSRNGRKRRHRSRFGAMSVMLAVFLLLICMSCMSRNLEKKNASYSEQVAQLTSKIEEESARTQEIEDLEEYMKTDEYIEDVARDKLGLVYEDETVFKPSEE